MLAYEVAVTSLNAEGEISAEWCIIASFNRDEAERVYKAIKPINNTAELREWKCEDDFTNPVEAIEFSTGYTLVEPNDEPDKAETGYQIYVKKPKSKSYTKWTNDELNWYSDEERAAERAACLTALWGVYGYTYIVVACSINSKS